MAACSQVKQDTEQKKPVSPMHDGKIIEETTKKTSENSAEVKPKYLKEINVEKCNSNKYPQLNADSKYVSQQLQLDLWLKSMLDDAYDRLKKEKPNTHIERLSLNEVNSLCACCLLSASDNKDDLKEFMAFVNHPAYKKTGSIFKLVDFYMMDEYPDSFTAEEIEYLKAFQFSKSNTLFDKFIVLLPSCLYKELPRELLPYIKG